MKLSRIDIIGQNSNEGSHYPPPDFEFTGEFRAPQHREPYMAKSGRVAWGSSKKIAPRHILRRIDHGPRTPDKSEG